MLITLQSVIPHTDSTPQKLLLNLESGGDDSSVDENKCFFSFKGFSSGSFRSELSLGHMSTLFFFLFFFFNDTGNDKKV